MGKKEDFIVALQACYFGDRNAFNKIVSVYDNLKQENKQLKEENKILRENAEHNDKVVDKVNWENLKLKKQLEEANEKILLLQASEPMLEYKKVLEENQQKEFIEWLENEKDRCLTFYSSTACMYAYDVFKDVLSKYNEIIGYVNE